ncbi:MAG: GAF and ANTAR domain-containing protein [Pseudonocardia sp.]|nr:GAF and ANTAR domain-containing protein [Pseudonocardia sp.]
MSASPEPAESFAAMARALQAAPTAGAVEALVPAYAIELVPGCDHAAVSVVDRHGGIVSVAPTDDVAAAVDALQHAVGEGPCFCAVRVGSPVSVPDLTAEDRWPRFSRRAAAETGVRSMLALRLFVEDDVLGALTLSARGLRAFDDRSVSLGTILAAHAALAVIGARTRRRCIELDEALRSSREIGTAVGILMCRRLVTPDLAFDLLRTASRRQHRKVRDLARDIVETGGLPDRGARSGGNR